MQTVEPEFLFQGGLPHPKEDARALGFTTTIFDHGKFNHTIIDGYASYKFGRDNPGYSLGIERPP